MKCREREFNQSIDRSIDRTGSSDRFCELGERKRFDIWPERAKIRMNCKSNCIAIRNWLEFVGKQILYFHQEQKKRLFSLSCGCFGWWDQNQHARADLNPKVIRSQMVESSCRRRKTQEKYFRFQTLQFHKIICSLFSRPNTAQKEDAANNRNRQKRSLHGQTIVWNSLQPSQLRYRTSCATNFRIRHARPPTAATIQWIGQLLPNCQSRSTNGFRAGFWPCVGRTDSKWQTNSFPGQVEHQFAGLSIDFEDGRVRLCRPRISAFGPIAGRRSSLEKRLPGAAIDGRIFEPTSFSKSSTQPVSTRTEQAGGRFWWTKFGGIQNSVRVRVWRISESGAQSLSRLIRGGWWILVWPKSTGSVFFQYEFVRFCALSSYCVDVSMDASINAASMEEWWNNWKKSRV